MAAAFLSEIWLEVETQIWPVLFQFNLDFFIYIFTYTSWDCL